jgi:hypothetical protein
MAEDVKTGVVDVESPEQLFEQLRGEIARVTVMRDGKVLDRVLPEEIDDDPVFWVKEKYGGGKYQLILFGKDGKVKKRLSFAIDGAPKLLDGEEKKEDSGTIHLVEKLIEKLEKKESSDNVLLLKTMMDIQQQNMKMMVELLKGEKKEEKSFIEKAIDKVFSNPEILLAAGGGLWKLIQKALASKNEILELVKVAKDDPELKELAIQAVGSKFGAGGGGFLDKILGDPNLLNKTLEIVNKALDARRMGINPVPVVKKELRELQGEKRNTLSGPVRSSRGESVIHNQKAPAPEVANPQGYSHVNNQEAGGEMGINIVEVGTMILDMAERGMNAEEILGSLSNEVIDGLAGFFDEAGIENHEGLIAVLESLPVPKFMVKGYVEAIRKHRELVDEFIGFFWEDEGEETGEVAGGNQEGSQVVTQAGNGEISGQIYRKDTGKGIGESQANHRKDTGEG